MICVAILDTGIEYDNSLKESIITGTGFINGLKKDDYRDDNGHGTKCANIIKLYSGNKVKFIIVKVLNEHMEGYEKDILLALEFLKDYDLDIIHMSMAMKNSKYVQEFKHLISYYNKKKVCMIASQYNRTEQICYPAHFEGVLGVKGIKNIEERSFYYHEKGGLNIEANGVPSLVQTLGGKIELFGGNSKATALFTGLLGKYMKTYPDLSVQEILTYFNNNGEPRYHHHVDCTGHVDEGMRGYIKQVKGIIEKVLRLKEIENQTNLYKMGLNNTNIDKVIKELSKCYPNLNYQKIFGYYELINVFHISYAIYKEREKKT